MKKISFLLATVMVSALLYAFPASVSADNADALKGKVIVAFGDSVTAGAKWSIVSNKFGCTVHNTGIVGENTNSAVNRFDETVPKYNPDIVLINYGLNDHVSQTVTPTAYKKNLETIAAKSAALGADVIFITPNPHYGASFEARNADYYKQFGGALGLLDDYYMLAMREVAMENGYGLVDVRAAWEGLTFSDYLSSDGLHPNTAGYTLAADTLCAYLNVAYCAPSLRKSIYVNYSDASGIPAKNGAEIICAENAVFMLAASNINGYEVTSENKKLYKALSAARQSYGFTYKKSGFTGTVTVSNPTATITLNGVNVGFFTSGFKSKSGFATLIRTSTLGSVSGTAVYWEMAKSKYDETKHGYIVTDKYKINESKDITVAADEILLCTYGGNDAEVALISALVAGDVLRTSSDVDLVSGACTDGISAVYVNGTAEVINAEAAKLEGISVYANPYKTSYTAGESVSLDGAVVKASYSNGCYKYITSGFDSEEKTVMAGATSVTVIYQDKKVAVSVKTEGGSEALTLKASSELTADKGYIFAANAGKTVSWLISEFESGDIRVKNSASDALIASGMTVELYKDGKAIASVKVCVKGDVDGDGVVGINDYIAIKAAFKQKLVLAGEYLAAADISGNGTLTVTDYIMLKRVFTNDKESTTPLQLKDNIG